MTLLDREFKLPRTCAIYKISLLNEHQDKHILVCGLSYLCPFELCIHGSQKKTLFGKSFSPNYGSHFTSTPQLTIKLKIFYAETRTGARAKPTSVHFSTQQNNLWNFVTRSPSTLATWTQTGVSGKDSHHTVIREYLSKTLPCTNTT